MHSVTGRPICAIPCDGVPEMCADDTDEQCEGPGLVLVLVITFISAVLFFAMAFASEHLSKAKEKAADTIEMEEYSKMEEWYIINLWINLSLCKHSIDYQKARTLARKYYDNAAILNNRMCPKDEYFMKYMGTNKLSELFYDCIDGSISVRVISFFNGTMPTLFQMWKKWKFDTLRNICECIISLTLKYSDLPKDCLLLYIIWIQLVTTDTGKFSLSIFCILSISILTSEIMHIFTILMTLRNCKGRSAFKIFHLISISPIMPAICLFKKFKWKLLQSKFLDELSKGCKNKMQAHLKLEVLDHKICNLNSISTKLHCNENVVENLFQLIILAIFMLLSNTNSKTVEKIDYLFMNKNKYITFILASMSLISIIRGQINFLKANKNGCLGIKGIIITIPYFLVATSARYIFIFCCIDIRF